MSELRIESDIEKQALERFNRLNGIKEPKLADSPFHMNVKRLKETVASAKNELKLSGADQFKLNKLNVEITQAAREDLKELLAAERERVAKEAERVAKAYERDLTTNAARYDRQTRAAALRYEAMSENELQQEVERFITRPEPMTPEQIDSLSREIKKVDPERHQTMREVIRKEGRYSGWKYTDDGLKVTKAATLLDQAMKEGDRVPLLLEDGSYRVEALADIVGGVA